MLKHLSHTVVRLGRAFQVLLRTDLLADVLGLQVRKLVSRFVPQSGDWQHTCSGVTGFWEVLCSSSMVFWSYRKSFLQPTRMIGRPWQKWRTSEIH